MSPKSILVADDDHITRVMLVAALESWGYEPIVVEDGHAAVQSLVHPNAPQMAILDWSMPSMSGIEVCRQVRLNRPTPYTYIVLLTHRDAQTDRLKGLESGADDFITKPFDPRELQLRLRTGVRILQLQRQLAEAHEASRLEANSDELTGLWNRRSLQPRLENEIINCRDLGRPLSVLMIDVDEFKSINDQAGHSFGDSVLKLVAQTIKACSRGDDFVSRFGGDEFLILLPGADEHTATKAAERIRLNIASAQILAEASSLAVSVSVGVAEVTTASDLTPMKALEMADQALYAAKRSGRNQVAGFGEISDEPRSRKLGLSGSVFADCSGT